MERPSAIHGSDVPPSRRGNGPPVPLPSLNDQHRIAAELRERLATIDTMTKSIEAELEAIEALPAAFLGRAFDEG